MGFHEGKDVTANLVSTAKLGIIGFGIRFDRCFFHRLLRPPRPKKKLAPHRKHGRLGLVSEDRGARCKWWRVRLRKHGLVSEDRGGAGCKRCRRRVHRSELVLRRRHPLRSRKW